MDGFNYINWQQHEDIKKLKAGRRTRILHSARASRSTNDKIEELEDEVMFLNLVNRALISMLQERGLITQDDFMNRISQLDEADGTIDGGSSGDDLARDIGFDELPVDREKEAPKAPVRVRKRYRD